MGAAALPPVDELAAELRGRTFDEVARKYGVTRQAVSMKLRRAGRADMNRSMARADYGKYIPWRVNEAMSSHMLIRLLRLYARDRESDPLTPAERIKLDRWTTYMNREKLVVAYGPRDGFRLVPKKPADRGYVRRPKGQPLS